LPDGVRLLRDHLTGREPRFSMAGFSMIARTPADYRRTEDDMGRFIKDREFLMDIAEAPLRDFVISGHKEKKENKHVTARKTSRLRKALSGKRVAIVGLGRQFDERIYDCLFTLSEYYNLKLKLSLYELREEDENTGIMVPKTDIMIFTGLTNMSFDDEDVDMCEAFLDAMANELPRQLIAFSDYRAYAQHVRDDAEIYFSEGEFISQSDDTPIRWIEKKSLGYMQDRCTVLRLGAAYGPCCDFRSVIQNMITAAARGQELYLSDDHRHMSYIYINDIMTALVRVLIDDTLTGIFNICTGAVNAAQLTAMVQDISHGWSDVVGQTAKTPVSVTMNSELFSLRTEWSEAVPLVDGLEIAYKQVKKVPGEFTFDSGYQGKLRVVHNILLGYLLYIDRICKAHDIKYFLGGGTLLGAVRHQGFIPWDDDVDVMMLRPDYDRFCEVVKKELPEHIFCQTIETEEACHQPFMKLRLEGTTFDTAFTAKFPELHHGIFIDILAQDRTAQGKTAQRYHVFKSMLVRSMVYNKWNGSEIQIGGEHPHLCRLATWYMRHKSQRKLDRWMDRTLRKYQGRDTGYLYDSMGRNIGKGAFPEEWLAEAVPCQFEGYTLPIPKEYDKYLTYLYGDYMKLLPVSRRRVSHDIVRIDLGKYADFGLDNHADIERLEEY